MTPEEAALLDAQMQAAVASAWIAAIAAIAAILALVFQYLLLPKPVLYVEDVHVAMDRSDFRIDGVLANRGNADAFDVRIIQWLANGEKPKVTMSPSHPAFPGFGIGDLGASQTSPFGFGNSEYELMIVQILWRQAPFMRISRKTFPKALLATHTRTKTLNSNGYPSVVFGEMTK